MCMQKRGECRAATVSEGWVLVVVIDEVKVRGEAMKLAC